MLLPFLDTKAGAEQILSSKPWDLSNSCPRDYLIWDFRVAFPLPDGIGSMG